MFTTTCHMSVLSQMNTVLALPLSLRSILILPSSHLQSGLFHSGFPTKTLYAVPFSPYVPHVALTSFKPTKVEPEEMVVFQEKTTQVHLCPNSKDNKYQCM
jgi:hypothetical protein